MNKQESQNEVSIIINGVRYDAVEEEGATCFNCELTAYCKDIPFEDVCASLVPLCVFRKSTKGFER